MLTTVLDSLGLVLLVVGVLACGVWVAGVAGLAVAAAVAGAACLLVSYVVDLRRSRT